MLILEGHAAMVLFLALDVRRHLVQVGPAHREIRVSALPLEARILAPLFLEPEVRDALELLNPLGLRDRAAEAGEKVNVEPQVGEMGNLGNASA